LQSLDLTADVRPDEGEGDVPLNHVIFEQRETQFAGAQNQSLSVGFVEGISRKPWTSLQSDSMLLFG
jgi:hypothetical protein